MITGQAKQQDKHLVLTFSLQGEGNTSARQLMVETLRANHFEIKADTMPDELVAIDSGSANPVADAATALTDMGAKNVIIENILRILGELHTISPSMPAS